MRNMEEWNLKSDKIEAIRRYFEPWIGQRLLKFETAQLKEESGQWSDWLDPPIRLFFDSKSIISIAWWYLDNLRISGDDSVYFFVEPDEIRWLCNENVIIRPAVSGTLKSVMLGRGDLVVGNEEIEIWTRLLLEFDTGWLEVFNNLDENGFAFYAEKPVGVFVKCF